LPFLPCCWGLAGLMLTPRTLTLDVIGRDFLCWARKHGRQRPPYFLAPDFESRMTRLQFPLHACLICGILLSLRCELVTECPVTDSDGTAIVFEQRLELSENGLAPIYRARNR
jgi:hypothetical protein